MPFRFTLYLCNMSGIYIHIPFCKQACHYCDFHFSTSLKYKSQLVSSIIDELSLRLAEVSLPIETIYFGGGTPSLLSSEEIRRIIGHIQKIFEVDAQAEITLEANPDDLDDAYLSDLSQTPVNRLSIGVQSFFQSDLKLMNRAHNSDEAYHSIQLAKKYFDNISIDLIYGIPDMTAERWLKNMETVFELDVPHVSCYALTVEPQTALAKFIEKKIIKPVDDAVAREHYDLLHQQMTQHGFDNYEFSNFENQAIILRIIWRIGQAKIISASVLLLILLMDFIGVGISITISNISRQLPQMNCLKKRKRCRKQIFLMNIS